jgi:hypothetical protein
MKNVKGGEGPQGKPECGRPLKTTKQIYHIIKHGDVQTPEISHKL